MLLFRFHGIGWTFALGPLNHQPIRRRKFGCLNLSNIIRSENIHFQVDTVPEWKNYGKPYKT